jgi:YihY family inner membrane protein
VSTARVVPVTRDELEGDEAFETLRACGLWSLLRDTAERFRAADGFSHSRALAFQATLALLPAVIAVVGLASALDVDAFTRLVRRAFEQIAPGPAGEVLTTALRQGSRTAREDSCEIALALGGFAAVLAGTTAMAQVERGANRIYGVEKDRPFVWKYGVGLLLAIGVGLALACATLALIGGSAVKEALGGGDSAHDVWRFVRWPLGLAGVVVAVSLLFSVSPRRKQPEPTWLMFGAGLATALWLVFVGVLDLYLEVANGLGETYGPVAGTIGLLLWSWLTSVALFFGLAFAAQLEAVRAGQASPRVDRHENR